MTAFSVADLCAGALAVHLSQGWEPPVQDTVCHGWARRWQGWCNCHFFGGADQPIQPGAALQRGYLRQQRGAGCHPREGYRGSAGNPKWEAKLSRFYYHTKEVLQGRKNLGEVKGRTNNPKGRDGMRSGAVIFNEVHQYQNYDNIKVFITGQGKVAEPRVGFLRPTAMYRTALWTITLPEVGAFCLRANRMRVFAVHLLPEHQGRGARPGKLVHGKPFPALSSTSDAGDPRRIPRLERAPGTER